MRLRDFNFDKFLYFAEEKKANLNRFMEGKACAPLLMQTQASEHFGAMSTNKYDSLSAQLDFLSNNMKLHGDAAITYLEPWHGVGIYAAAFGCPLKFFPGQDTVTTPIIESVSDVSCIKYPDLKTNEALRQILETIAYFREQTGSEIDISLTDTQSPNDTASLIMETTEFFSACIAEPESLDPLLSSITKLIIEFSEVQMDAIGHNIASPGHLFPSGNKKTGLSISDDNMSFVSPGVYEKVFKPYNERISLRFNGLYVHSCGRIAHNLPLMLQTKEIRGLETSIGYASDPDPNRAEDLVEFFKGSNVILKVRVGWDEVKNVKPLLNRQIRLIVQIITSGMIDEKNEQFDKAQDDIMKMYNDSND